MLRLRNNGSTFKTGWNCNPRLPMNPTTMHWHMMLDYPVFYQLNAVKLGHVSTCMFFYIHVHLNRRSYMFEYVWWMFILHTSIKNQFNICIEHHISQWIALSRGRILCGREVIHHLTSQGPLPAFQGLEFWHTCGTPVMPSSLRVETVQHSAGSLQMLGVTMCYPLEMSCCSGKSEPIGLVYLQILHFPHVLVAEDTQHIYIYAIYSIWAMPRPWRSGSGQWSLAGHGANKQIRSSSMPPVQRT